MVAAGADLGVELDPSAEQVRLIDERGEPISGSQLLLLLVALAARRGLEGAIAVPVTATDRVEELAAGTGLRIRARPRNAAALTAIAATDGRAARRRRRRSRCTRSGRFPRTTRSPPSRSCSSSRSRRIARCPLLVGELPTVNLVHDDVHCPWAAKGAVMRTLIDEAKGYETDNLDGLVVRLDEGWVSLMPDPDHPRFHVFAEGRTPEDSADLRDRYRARLIELVLTQESAPDREVEVLAKPSTSG